VRAERVGSEQRSDAARAALRESEERLQALGYYRLAEQAAAGQTTSERARAIEAERDRRSDAKAQVDFGIAVAQAGLWREAASRWQQAVEIDPGYAEAWNHLGIGYEQLGSFNEARAAFEKAMALDPANSLNRARQIRSQLLQKEVVTDPAATVRVGDTVTVEIHGETDVPSSYVIAAAGTIRLPFMEPVKVVGLTRAQVEAVLVKQLQRVMKDVALEVAFRRSPTSR